MNFSSKIIKRLNKESLLSKPWSDDRTYVAVKNRECFGCKVFYKEFDALWLLNGNHYCQSCKDSVTGV